MEFLVSYGPYSSWDAAGVVTVTTFCLRAIKIGSAKVAYTGTMGLLSCFFKGILCNWLVCLALFLGLAADDVISKIAALWFPIMAFATSGFEHCVANMFFIPAAIITNGFTGNTVTNLNWAGMWTNKPITKDSFKEAGEKTHRSGVGNFGGAYLDRTKAKGRYRHDAGSIP